MTPDALLAELPLVAILRGVTPARIEGVADALFDAGIRAIEVPLNSPEPFKSIEMLAKTFGDRCLTGAGTVLTSPDVDRVARCGRQAAGDAQHQSGGDRARRGKGPDGDAGFLHPQRRLCGHRGGRANI